MKKLSKVIFIVLLLAAVVLPLSAKKVMVVSWQWMLSDPDVTEYRYQLNGEKEGGWTVVDAKTSSYTADGLDPYSDYTLYLQCSYDGVNWSLSASSTAYALLEEPVAIEEVTPAVQTADFTLFGVNFHNTYSGTTFTSSINEKGFVTADDIVGFINWVNGEYSYLVDYVTVDSITDGEMVLTVPAGLDFTNYVELYKDEIEKYMDYLIAELGEAEKTASAAVETKKAEEVAPVVPEVVEETVPVAPEAVEAAPVKEEKKETSKKYKASFNLGLTLGAEWSFPSISDFKNPTYSYLPRAGLVLEGQNLLLAGPVGLGIRSDISAVALPDGLNYSNILEFKKMGYDLTADLKLMGYINGSVANFYLGAGMGYSLASSGVTSNHTAGALGPFDSGFALTAVTGLGFNLGERVSLGLEAYGRYFFGSFKEFKLGQLSLASSLGLKFKF